MSRKLSPSCCRSGSVAAPPTSAPQLKKPSLTETHPMLAQEWHPTKNDDRIPQYFTAGSRAKVWWLCKKSCVLCGAAHEWEAMINHRTCSMPTGCPFCSGRQVCRCSSLAAERPDLVVQWDFAGNKPLDPEQIATQSKKMVSWLCSQHGPWYAMVYNRVNGNGCPKCAAEQSRRKRERRGLLRDEHPELIAQLHPNENDHIDLSKVTSGSSIKAVWVCDDRQLAPPGCTHPHVWTAAIKSRVGKGSACPICAGREVCPCNSLTVKAPEVAAEWHLTRNGDMHSDQMPAFSSLRVWWQHVSELTGEVHEWEARVGPRVRTWKKEGRLSCPLCYKDRQQKLICRSDAS